MVRFKIYGNCARDVIVPVNTEWAEIKLKGLSKE